MSKRKLLLADDSMTIQKVVNLTFADEGIEVFTVGNGSLAIEKLSEVKPDLVLADVHMPGLNGYEVCEQIKSNPQFKDVPVMLLVGSFEPFDEREAERVGANDYLTKPFQSIRQLIQKVTTLLDNPQSKVSVVGGALVIADIDNSVEEAANEDLNESLNESLSENSGEVLPDDLVTASDNLTVTAQNEFEESNRGISFGDTALDDEMIETSSGNSFDGDYSNSTSSTKNEASNTGEIKTTRVETVSEFSNEDLLNIQDSNEAATEAEYDSTEPLSLDDYQEANFVLATATEPKTQDDWQPFELETDMTGEPTTETDNSAQNTFSNVSYQPASFAPQEEIFEISDFEISNSEISDSENTIPVENRSATNLAFSSVNQSTGMEYELLELDLDEINLLQVDDEGENGLLDLQVEELPTGIVATTDFEILMPVGETTTQNFSDSNNNAPTQIGNQSVASLSSDFPPEVIDAIVRQVVERLSDKVIEKIAWEVVPDRLDIIVRRHLNDRDR